MSQPETYTEFLRALTVINEALVENREKMPYKQIIEAGGKLLEGQNIGVAVYANDPDTPFDYYTIKFENDQLQLVSHGKQEPDISWKVSRDYLHQVKENAAEYVKRPEKLDWDWLLDRLGLSK